MSSQPRRTLALAALLVLPLAGCEDDVSRPDLDGLVYGDAVALGAGNARSYVQLENGTPVEIGVALSEQALQGLPAGNGDANDHSNMFVHLLPMPDGVPLQFNFVELDWNPAGHEPPGIYDLPHFDFHFNLNTEAERLAIDPADPAFQQMAENVPAQEFMPAGYVAPALVAVPRMGVHWIDPTSPELNGETFTATFIYGTWDGELIFAEPMITREFLLSKPSFNKTIPAPARVQKAGPMPTAYRIYWNETTKEYRVALASLVARS